MKNFLPALLCTLLSACATPAPTADAAPTAAEFPRLRSAMPQMPCAKPIWPQEALRRKLTGTVTMKFLIDADGRVLEKELVKSSGHKMLDDAALEGTARCKLTVAKDGNLPQEWVINQYVWTWD